SVKQSLSPWSTPRCISARHPRFAIAAGTGSAAFVRAENRNSLGPLRRDTSAVIRFVRAFIGSAVVIVATGCAVAAEQLVVNGQPRTFVIERPAATGPRPTMIVLHGAGGSGAGEAQSDIGRLAPQAGLVAVFPDGRANRWNHLPPGKEQAQYVQAFQQHGGAPDDVAFLKALVADLVHRGVADPKRVYLAGTSAGGIMTMRMACLGDGTFAAIALLVAAMPEATGADCRLSAPLPVLMINGTADDVMPYGGGVGFLPNTRIPGVYRVWPTERLVTFFRQHNGCAEPAEKSEVPGPGSQRGELERSKGSGGAVHFYRVVGGRHDLRAHAVNAGPLLVDFFRGLSAPADAAIAPATVATGDDPRTCFSGAVADANVAACGRLIASSTLRGNDLISA